MEVLMKQKSFTLITYLFAMFMQLGSAENLFAETIINKEDALCLYNKGEQRVIVRAMDRDIIDYGGPSLDMLSWNQEISQMKRNEYKHASSTLIVNGQKVMTYKGCYGFIFSAEGSELTHICKGDSGSATGDAGNLMAAGETISLDELTKYIREVPYVQKNQSYNEINGNFVINDLKGLYIKKLPSNCSTCVSSQIKLEILIAQKQIQKRHGIFLPIFQYDTDGRLEEFTEGKESWELELLIRRASGSNSELKELYQQKLNFRFR